MKLSGLQLGLLGIMKGRQGMQKAAADIASATTAPTDSASDNKSAKATPDLVEAVVNLKKSERLTQASIKYLQVNDQVLGEFLDIIE